MEQKEERFPVGGPRQPVYDFLQRNGFMMSRHSDKQWNRADGLELHLYGTGSMARVLDKDRKIVVDDKLEKAVISLPNTSSR